MEGKESSGGKGRKVLSTFIFLVQIGMFLLLINLLATKKWMTAGIYLVALFGLVVWRKWDAIIWGTELVETYIWGMPIKDPDWKTKRWKRRLVFKWK